MNSQNGRTIERNEMDIFTLWTIVDSEDSCKKKKKSIKRSKKEQSINKN